MSRDRRIERRTEEVERIVAECRKELEFRLANVEMSHHRRVLENIFWDGLPSRVFGVRDIPDSDMEHREIQWNQSSIGSRRILFWLPALERCGDCCAGERCCCSTGEACDPCG